MAKVERRDCPKRGTSNAPGMNLAGVQRTEGTEKGFSAVRRATPRARPGLFGQSQSSTLAILRQKG